MKIDFRGKYVIFIDNVFKIMYNIFISLKRVGIFDLKYVTNGQNLRNGKYRIYRACKANRSELWGWIWIT